ncbi:MAG: long-chain acyl-CoA synthetase [Actinomycetota bacterium]|jgi:acyl-CoA synthetase (AMP-forming)/AMP-acid ligase II|nr:long-chain acyl-CoA synthetase [Actinomycetota bacterium]
MHPGVHAETTPDKVAYVMAGSGEEVTYRQLDDRSNQLAQLLHDRGLRPGDSVAICMENNARYLEATWAAQRSGLYYTCVSSRLTVGEAEYILNDCEAKALVMSNEKRDLAEQLADKIPNVHTRLMIGGAVEGFEPYEDVVGKYPTEPIAEQLEGTDKLYSSGTTGRPKGVKTKLARTPFGENPGGVGLLTQFLYGFTADTVYLSPAPLYHAAPLRFVMAALRLGSTVVVMEHFDPVEYLRCVERYKVTHTQVVPTMFVRMLKLPAGDRAGVDVSSLQTVIHAAAPCPIPVKEQMIEWWGPVIHEYYAGTEGNGFVACNSADWLAHKGTVGKPLTGALHICDDAGNELPNYESGTIYFESAVEFEYHNDPEKTKGSRHPSNPGWSTLGDIGYVDDEGFLFLTDRKANMIISGGVNIYPQEAENVLTMHPKVMDVAVFGIPNEDFGEEVKAVVQPADMGDAGPELERELLAFCKEHLAAFKVPRSIDFEADLPRHPTGKLYKRLLRDRYWQGHQSKLV